MWQWLERKLPPDSEIDEELEYHLAMLAAEQRDRGDSSGAAQAFAKRKTGNITLIKEGTRAAWRTPWLEEAQRDLHFTARMFARSPFFYSLVIGILALGITASVARFRLTNPTAPSPIAIINSFPAKPPPFQKSPSLIASVGRESRYWAMTSPYNCKAPLSPQICSLSSAVNRS
jgi:hypothetical protein